MLHYYNVYLCSAISSRLLGRRRTINHFDLNQGNVRDFHSFIQNESRPSFSCSLNYGSEGTFSSQAFG